VTHELAVSGILKSLFVFIGIPVWSLASTSNTASEQPIIGQNRVHDDVIPALKKVIIVICWNFIMAININYFTYFHIKFYLLFTNDVQT
jgi:hypothetical protein